ncbi:serine/threonine-protein kinase 24/25/MST4 [Geosmithia morbida]|uniref:Serine/threonine-protein kinase 24/25/MST4 n=1 Tax=Geosmithia morbida TaxID=1094350 RepID=A0A9P4Z1J5_9HYPO|nr:serine/threonine-protein kinase 24/25/MST4 [Geosmithia morbida]KAF4126998.1 serine/threonine-protein kinase 24/25/MST4 [Geosmithia morbida]
MADPGDQALDPQQLYSKEYCIGGGSFGKVYKGNRRHSTHHAEPQRINEDMWDFGTVKLVGDKGGIVNRPVGLNPMDDNATNARANRPPPLMAASTEWNLDDDDDYSGTARAPSPTKARDFAPLQPNDTLKAASGTSRPTSPQRKPVGQQPAVAAVATGASAGVFTGSPSKVPLPSSPSHRVQTHAQSRNYMVNPDTPRQSRNPLPAPPRQSPDYDRELQAQLQRDMGGLNLNLDLDLGLARQQQDRSSTSSQDPDDFWASDDKASLPIPPAQRQEPLTTTRPAANSRVPSMTIPEIPPFRGGAVHQQQQQQQQRLPSQPGVPIATQRMPAPPGISGQKPLPTAELSSSPAAASASAAPTSFPTPAPANPNGELDALNDVIFPALEEALKRRQIRVQQVYGGVNGRSTSQMTADQQKAEAAHEKLRKLVFKLAHVAKEIDHYDKAEPVGMGRDEDVSSDLSCNAFDEL